MFPFPSSGHRKGLPRLLPLIVGAGVWAFATLINAADYTVSTGGGFLVVTDVSGNGDVLTLSEPAPDQIAFAAPGRTFSVDGGSATAGTSGSLSLVGITSVTVNAGAGADNVTLGTFLTPLPSLNLNAGTGNDQINFTGDLTLRPNASLEVNLQDDDAVPGTDIIQLAANVNVVVSGTGNLLLKCSQSLTLDAGASLELANGSLVVEANQQAVASAGAFSGIALLGSSLLCSGTGSIDLKGRGGNSGNFNPGVQMQAGAVIRGGTLGLLKMTGRGGASTGLTSHGIFMDGAGTKLHTLGAAAEITGLAGGAGTGGSSHGVIVQNSAQVSTGGVGNLLLQGTGGVGSGNNNFGISLVGTSTSVFTSGGTLTLTGSGGSGIGSNNYGINLQNGPSVLAGGAGTVNVLATGGTGLGRFPLGLTLTGTGTQISSAGGDVHVTGLGGGSSYADSAYGVLVQSAAVIKAGGLGSVTVQGTGGPGTGSTNLGVYLTGANALITSSGGNVQITGQGGGTGTGRNNYGVNLQNGGGVSAGGLGTVNVTGAGGQSSGFGNYGIFMVTNPTTQITSGGGNIAITATAGTGIEGDCRGMQLQTGPGIIGVGPASVSINCTGGLGTGAGNYGLRLVAGVSITAVDGDISITSQAGNAEAVAFSLSNYTAPGAKVQTTGAGQISLAADSMDLSTTDVLIDAGIHNVTLRPKTAGTAMDLGSTNFTTPGVLELSDAELDRVTAGTLTLGGPTTGAITLSAPLTRPAPAGGVRFLSNTGLVPAAAGVDVTCDLCTLPAGQNLQLSINGLTTNTQFTQWSVAGAISLQDAQLQLTGSFVPTVGHTFLLINNDGIDPIQGTFAQLPEHAPLLFNGTLMRLTYHGGDGNDVLLQAVAPDPPHFTQIEITPAPNGNPGRHLLFTIDGGLTQGDLPLLLQYTDDLTTWHPLATTNASHTGMAMFDLIDTTAGERRFYRGKRP